ncbi:MAG: cation:proton antiporter [Nanoarchaeota archaeon]|nr:cation:proton antiporter [Nanoarchaeota archaeon]
MALFVLFGIAGLIIFIGFLGELIFKSTNIPDVIWLMLVGIVLNIFSKDIASQPAFQSVAPIFTTFALLFILFEGAMNINIKQFIKGIVGGVNITVFSFVLSSLAAAFFMMLFLKWRFIESLLLGSIIGGTSSAIVIPIIKKISLGSHATTVLTIESAISDVLCIVGSITIIDILVFQTLQVPSVFEKLLYSFIVAGVLGTLAGLFWIRFQKFIQQFSKSYMTTIAYLLIVYSFVEYIKSNGAIACLFFGLIYGNSKKIEKLLPMGDTNGPQSVVSPSAKFFYSEISFFVKSFFFVYLGLIIDFTDYWSLLIGLALTILLFLVRPLAVFMTTKKTTQKKDKVFMEILAPKGLAAAVLAQLPLHNGIANGLKYSTIVSSVIFFSILLSTLLVFLTEKGHFNGLRLPKMNLSKIQKSRKKEKSLKEELDEDLEKRKGKKTINS